MEYDLSGIGTQLLTAATARIFVSVTTYPTKYGFGRANPENLYDIGQLRFLIDGFCFQVFSIDAAQMVVDLPSGVDTLGYSLFGPSTIHVAETTPPTPPGAEVHTSVDGTTFPLGAYLDIIWSGVDSAAIDDRITIQPVTATDITDRAAFTGNFWVYANSCSPTPEGPPPASGTCHGQTEYTGDFTDPYHARYYFGGSDTDFIHGPEFTITSG